jgi:hypothetical protein
MQLQLAANCDVEQNALQSWHKLARASEKHRNPAAVRGTE